MSKPIVKIRPKWYLYWSPKAWKLSKAQESILNWWLSKLENKAKIVDIMFDVE